MEIGIILNGNNTNILIEIPDIISNLLRRIIHQPFTADNHSIMSTSN